MAIARASRGQRVGPYLLERRLGAGGMAEVFLARPADPALATQRVAVKKILPEHAEDERMLEMFCDEAKIAARLVHPNIARVLDFGEHAGEPFIAMEYVDGTTCSSILKCVTARNENVPVHAALFVAHEVLDALSFAHSACDDDGQPLGLVHRDVSPSNVLVGRAGEVKLIDFGITRSRLNERPTIPGELRGKLRYLAPEQIMGGEIDARTDLYSLGVFVAEMLLGRALFKGKSELETITRICRGDAEELLGAALPRPLYELLQRALAYRQEDRFQSAGDFQSRLVEAAGALALSLDDTELVPWVHKLDVFSSTSATRARAVSTARAVSGTPTFKEPPGSEPGAADFGHFREELVRQRLPQVRRQQRSGERRRASIASVPDVERASLAPEEAPESLTPTALTNEGPAPHGPRGPARPSVTYARATYRLKTPRGTVLGPLTREQLLEMLATGRSSAKTLVSLDGEHFVPAGSIPALAPMATRGAYAFAEPLDRGASWSAPIYRVTLPGALYNIAIERRSGLLVLRDSARQMRLYLENGDPTFIASTDRSQLLGHRLVESGTVSPKLVELALHNQPPLRLGEALVTLGALSPAQLVRELALQLEDRFLSIGAYHQGEMTFFAARRSGEESVRTKTPTLHLVTQLVRTAYDAAELAAILGPFAGRPLVRGPRYRALSTLLGLQGPEYTALERASGTSSTQTLVAELAREGVCAMPEALRAVFIGLSASVLRCDGWARSRPSSVME